ncbi:unnamed protein product [Meganyctiphanes norvegica]|uniref:Replication factor-A protein 1 N-terminal domain-containing protein n=1 Tax=Meganyctiphanes norvegica TaxID=48144 RepID=A0AAV2SHI4_MEGNR
MKYELTRGALRDILEGGYPDHTTYLQILSIPHNPKGGQVHQNVILSDGQWMSNLVVLERPLYSKIASGEINKYCIIRIMELTWYDESKRILVILNLQVLQSGTEVGCQIGNPQPFFNIKKTSTPAATPVPHTPVPLSRGAIAEMFTRGKPIGGVLQLLNITCYSLSKDDMRYFMHLSDGQWSSKDVMLHQKLLNPKVQSGEITFGKNCIIDVHEFYLHKTLLVILDLTVIRRGKLEKIGDPQPFDINASIKGAASTTNIADSATTSQAANTAPTTQHANTDQYDWVANFQKWGIYIKEATPRTKEHIWNNNIKIYYQ